MLGQFLVENLRRLDKTDHRPVPGRIAEILRNCLFYQDNLPLLCRNIETGDKRFSFVHHAPQPEDI
jgi:hypothetical protein